MNALGAEKAGSVKVGNVGTTYVLTAATRA